jgi:hypothetical protein
MTFGEMTVGEIGEVIVGEMNQTHKLFLFYKDFLFYQRFISVKG